MFFFYFVIVQIKYLFLYGKVEKLIKKTTHVGISIVTDNCNNNLSHELETMLLF